MSDEYQSESVPGVGGIMGRAGTSTIELAGAASYWHGRSKTAFRSGMVTLLAVEIMLSLIVGSVYYALTT